MYSRRQKGCPLSTSERKSYSSGLKAKAHILHYLMTKVKNEILQNVEYFCNWLCIVIVNILCIPYMINVMCMYS